jgi:hypothetical protein
LKQRSAGLRNRCSVRHGVFGTLRLCGWPPRRQCYLLQDWRRLNNPCLERWKPGRRPMERFVVWLRRPTGRRDRRLLGELARRRRPMMLRSRSGGGGGCYLKSRRADHRPGSWRNFADRQRNMQGCFASASILLYVGMSCEYRPLRRRGWFERRRSPGLDHLGHAEASGRQRSEVIAHARTISR